MPVPDVADKSVYAPIACVSVGVGYRCVSATEAGPALRDPVLRQVLEAVRAQPSGEHSLATMAARASVSQRHLTRLFRREIGATPARYVEQIRVQAAQALLETGDAGVTAIARTCGFGSAQTMRRAFQRVAGVTPAAYRRRFRAQRL